MTFVLHYTNNHFLRTAEPHSPDSPGRIRRTVLETVEQWCSALLIDRLQNKKNMISQFPRAF